MSIVLFFTSSIHEPPPYHILFTVFAFIMSSVWMYLASNELTTLFRVRLSQILVLP